MSFCGVCVKCFPVFLETGLSLIFCDLGFCCYVVWVCRADGFVLCALTNRGLAGSNAGRWYISDRLDLLHCCARFCLFVFVCVVLLRGGVGFCVQGVCFTGARIVNGLMFLRRFSR